MDNTQTQKSTHYLPWNRPSTRSLWKYGSLYAAMISKYDTFRKRDDFQEILELRA
jgi:hypothetical protein